MIHIISWTARHITLRFLEMKTSSQYLWSISKECLHYQVTLFVFSALPIFSHDRPDATESTTPNLPKLRSEMSSTSSSYFTIDREGEMPEGAGSHLNAQGSGSSIAGSAVPSPLRVSSTIFAADGGEPTTPEPIKVMRAKKKTGTKKKRKDLV